MNIEKMNKKYSTKFMVSENLKKIPINSINVKIN